LNPKSLVSTTNKLQQFVAEVERLECFTLRQRDVAVIVESGGAALLARPMDAEFVIVEADDDRLSPFDQIVVLIKACCKNQRTRLELAPEISGNCRRTDLRFFAASQNSWSACCGFEQGLKFSAAAKRRR
jgi:hypothetical protein